MNKVILLQGKVILLLFMFCHFQDGISQSRPESDTDKMMDTLKVSSKVFILPANIDISKVSWRDSLYRFPSFKEGRVTFATGYSPEEKIRLNYNFFFAQMDFIDQKGDTLQIKRSKELRLITIGDHVFYHDYRIGYIEIIHRLPVALGVWKILRTDEMKYKSGDFEGMNPADVRGGPSGYDRYYRIWGRYYFIDKDNQVYNTTRQSILKLFYDHKKEINAYLNKNRIDFEMEEDLIKLLTFCNGQEQQK